MDAWEKSDERWERNDQRWEENQKAINEILSSIKIVEINDQKLKDLFNSTVGALGARGIGPDEDLFVTN
jgi:hypothetical protein